MSKARRVAKAIAFFTVVAVLLILILVLGIMVLQGEREVEKRGLENTIAKLLKLI